MNEERRIQSDGSARFLGLEPFLFCDLFPLILHQRQCFFRA